MSAFYFYCLLVVSISSYCTAQKCCSELLVSGSHSIADVKITASSTYPNTAQYKHNPYRSRICAVKKSNGENGGWSAHQNNDKQWLQFDFGEEVKVTGVVTKGRQHHNQRVTEYRISYGNSHSNMNPLHLSNGKIQVFTGNVDANTPVTHYFEEAVKARYVRIHPTKWNSHVSMRADILGCPDTESSCDRCLVASICT